MIPGNFDDLRFPQRLQQTADRTVMDARAENWIPHSGQLSEE